MLKYITKHLSPLSFMPGNCFYLKKSPLEDCKEMAMYSFKIYSNSPIKTKQLD